MGKKETAARRLAIIHTARDLFAEKNYHETKISDITKRLEISQGTFYNYFKNKSDVFTHIIKEYIKRLEKVFLTENPTASNNAIEFREHLVRLENELFDIFIEDQNMYDILFHRARITGIEIEKEVKKLFETTDLFVKRYLVHGINNKFLRSSIDASLNAKAIRGMTMVALEDLMENNAPLQLKERWILSLSNFIIDGLS
jgi:AcrR family transcriptional regulator